MLYETFKNLITDPVSILGLIVFYILLISLPFTLINALNNKISYSIRNIVVSVNFLLAIQLISRWVISSHFPVSNLYESLCFLAWGITLGQLILENEYPSPIIPAVSVPMVLLALGFACFVLPEDLKLSSNLVPALRSSWLIMHVTVVMLSYAALIIGSLLSATVLFIEKNQPLQIRSNSYGIGGYKLTSPNSIDSIIEPVKFSTVERLDTLSYRSILIGFLLLTLGLISGAVWANEAWGTWWSWDPKETWALISWLFYAAYLHMRISKGWQGRRPAALATFGFFIVLICYIGVNFLGLGLHSYGWFL